MDEAEHLADRIAVIADGVIVATGTPQTLGGRDRLATTITFRLPDGIAPSALPAQLQAIAEPSSDTTVVLHSHTALVHAHDLSTWAIAAGFDLPDLEVRRPTLEDVYLSLTDERKDKNQWFS